MELFDRVYELKIGDSESGDGLLINNLEMSFSVTKSANNKEKVDKATIKVFNLSDQSLSFLDREYAVVVFSCGYRGSLVRLFYGSVLDFDTKKRGTDRITTIKVSPYYSELTHKIISQVVAEDSLVENVIEEIRKEIPGLAKGVYKGEQLKLKTVYGYPLTGTPRQMLDQVCEAYRLEWRIDNQSLYINSYRTTTEPANESAPVLSPTTGLIDRPYAMKGSEGKSRDDNENTRGVKLTALINPTVVPGSVVRVDYNEDSQFYKVEEVEFKGDFRGRDWYMECICIKTGDIE